MAERGLGERGDDYLGYGEYCIVKKEVNRKHLLFPSPPSIIQCIFIICKICQKREYIAA